MKTYKSLLKPPYLYTDNPSDIPVDILGKFNSEVGIDFSNEKLICACWNAKQNVMVKPAVFFVIVTDKRIVSRKPTGLGQNYWDSVTGIEKNIYKDIVILSAGNKTNVFSSMGATNLPVKELVEVVFERVNSTFNKSKNSPLTPSNNSSDDFADKLEKLKSLLDSGVLTQEEFDEKKKSILENL